MAELPHPVVLTVWVSDEAIAQWKAAPHTTPGGQPCHSDLAITTALMLRAVFRLALRQTEGLVASALCLRGLDLPVPEPAWASAATIPPSPGTPERWRCRARGPAPAERPTCWWSAPG